MDTFNTTVRVDGTKSIQNICPKFAARTPYLIVFMSSTLSIWSSVIIFAYNMYKKKDIPHDDHKYERTSIELSTVKSGKTPIQTESEEQYE